MDEGLPNCTGTITGAGVIKDSSGSNNNGTPTNLPSWSNDTPFGTGCSVAFDGSATDMQVHDASNLKYTGQGMTWSIWIKVNASENSGGSIISKPWNGGGDYNYSIALWSSRTFFFQVGGSTTWAISSNVTLPTGRWQFITASVDASKNVNLYVNGVIKAQGTHTVTNWTPPSAPDGNIDLAIGTLYPYGNGWGGNTAYSFDGSIDNLRIYDRALDVAEIQKLYAIGAPKHGIAFVGTPNPMLQ
jgi:hypothetical protein